MRGFFYLAFLAYYAFSPWLAMHLTGSRGVGIVVAIVNVVAMLAGLEGYFSPYARTVTIRLAFVENVEKVLRHAWSVRFLVLATVLDAAQTGCSFFSGSDLIHPPVLAGLNMALALAALGARLVAQEAVSGTTAPADGGQA